MPFIFEAIMDILDFFYGYLRYTNTEFKISDEWNKNNKS
jgi:hypothetical protein